MSDEIKPRWRGPKFEPEEKDLLIDLAIKHKFIVQSKLNNKIPKQLKDVMRNPWKHGSKLLKLQIIVHSKKKKKKIVK